MKFTVLGSTGFIGSHLVRRLKILGYDVFTPSLNDILTGGNDLGYVFYCIGLTGNFRKHPMDTVEAHVAHLLKVLRLNNYTSFLYLSSSRVYQGAKKTLESSDICVNPNKFDQHYNLSKLMGESLCLNCGHDNMHVVRLSNVVGNSEHRSHSFIPMVIEDALLKGHVTLHSSLNSSKDYVYIDDVVNVLPKIIKSKGRGIYNVASGKNICHKKIIKHIIAATSCTYDVVENPPLVTFPEISIDKICKQFNFTPINIIDVLPEVIGRTKERLT